MHRRTNLIFLLVLAIGVQAAERSSSKNRNQIFESESRGSVVFELFQSEADSEISWGDISLDYVRDREHWLPIVWHVKWRDTANWRDGYALIDSDRRQEAHVATGGADARFTPQAIIRGREWRGLLRGDRPPEIETGEIGVIRAEVYPTGVVLVTFEPGQDFRHIGVPLVANIARLAPPESRIIGAGPAMDTRYKATDTVLEHQQARYDEQRERWRFRFEKDRLWPAGDPPARLAIWLEPQTRPRPIHGFIAELRPLGANLAIYEEDKR